MLVLTRKRGESIHIAGEIQVEVLSVQGNRVRLGITAPSDVDVRRGELVFDLDASTQEFMPETELALS
ncbi:carbon storage regulator [bacterium]|nr:carbon storage regulator [bacterium]